MSQIAAPIATASQSRVSAGERAEQLRSLPAPVGLALGTQFHVVAVSAVAVLLGRSLRLQASAARPHRGTGFRPQFANGPSAGASFVGHALPAPKPRGTDKPEPRKKPNKRRRRQRCINKEKMRRRHSARGRRGRAQPVPHPPVPVNPCVRVARRREKRIAQSMLMRILFAAFGGITTLEEVRTHLCVAARRRRVCGVCPVPVAVRGMWLQQLAVSDPLTELLGGGA